MKPAEINDKYITCVGWDDSLNTVSGIDLSTLRHSDELIRELIDSKREIDYQLLSFKNILGGDEFATSDLFMYSLEDDRLMFYLARRKFNIFINNLDETAGIEARHYVPRKEDIKAVKNAEDTLKINVAELGLESLDFGETGFFQFKTRDYSKLNKGQKLITERTIGQDIAEILNPTDILTFTFLKMPFFKETSLFSSEVIRKNFREQGVAIGCGNLRFGDNNIEYNYLEFKADSIGTPRAFYVRGEPCK